MPNKQLRRIDYHRVESAAWTYYIRKFVKVYVKTKMLKVGLRSWWSQLNQTLPEDFVDDYGSIREPWLSALAEWIQMRGLKMVENIDGLVVDNVLPAGISAVLIEKQLESQYNKDHEAKSSSFSSSLQASFVLLYSYVVKPYDLSASWGTSVTRKRGMNHE